MTTPIDDNAVLLEQLYDEEIVPTLERWAQSGFSLLACFRLSPVDEEGNALFASSWPDDPKEARSLLGVVTQSFRRLHPPEGEGNP